MRAKPSIVGVGYCLVKYNLFIYYMRTYSRHRGVRVGQRQEKRGGKTSEKSEERKGIEVRRVKLLTPSRTVDALIGDE